MVYKPEKDFKDMYARYTRYTRYNNKSFYYMKSQIQILEKMHLLCQTSLDKLVKKYMINLVL